MVLSLNLVPPAGAAWNRGEISPLSPTKMIRLLSVLTILPLVRYGETRCRSRGRDGKEFYNFF